MTRSQPTSRTHEQGHFAKARVAARDHEDVMRTRAAIRVTKNATDGDDRVRLLAMLGLEA
ncbi:hypothetical protein [Amycolatopsis sp. NPDC059657]|uniref:hypothetical protein n=1 Tax=Amycolatopsis sp. NPDC059657 TaxID=3346899 RepID=UPI00367265CF